jgi:flagellar biosynthesis protein FliR
MTDTLASWVLAELRIGPTLILTPPLAWPGLPWQLRAAAAAVLGASLAPLVTAGGHQVSLTVASVGGEAATGLLLALIVSLPFWSAAVAGAMADAEAGATDDEGEGRWSQAIFLLAAAAVVAVRGHILVAAGIAGSYRSWPAGADISATALPILARSATEMLGAALLMVLPLLFFAALVQVLGALTGRLTGQPSPLPVRPVVIVLGLLAAVPVVGAVMSREVAAALIFLSGGGAG